MKDRGQNLGKGIERAKAIRPVSEYENGLEWVMRENFSNRIISKLLVDKEARPTVSVTHETRAALGGGFHGTPREINVFEIVDFAIAALKTAPDSPHTTTLRNLAHERLTQQEAELVSMRKKLLASEGIDPNIIDPTGESFE